MLQLISSWQPVLYSVFAFGVLSFFCFVLLERSGFLNFFVWNLQTVSPLKLDFLKGPSFFVRSVCNHGALKLHLHVVALPASLARSWPAEITKKLSRSGLDFLVLVLESCNSFIMNAFFNFASVNFFQATWFRFSFCRQGLVVPLFCSPCDDWISRFFQFENFKLFSVKLNFSEGPSFFVPFVCNHGAFNLRLHV